MSGRCEGFTLIEALCATAILGIALVGILPTFTTYVDSNTMSEERSGAMAVGQQVLEQVRLDDPADLPESGSSDMTLVAVGQREYEVVTHYCVESGYCDDDSRHIVVEISFGGYEVYSLESVFTSLR